MDFDLKVVIIVMAIFLIIALGAMYTDYNQTINMANKHYTYLKGWYPDVILRGIK